MTTVTLRAKGKASPDEIWDRYARPARWHEWSPQILRVLVAEPDGRRVQPDLDVTIAAGLAGRVIGPLGVTIDFVVDEVSDEYSERHWAWSVRLGPIHLQLRHGVTATPDGGATSLVVTGPAPIVFGYAPIARLALSKLVKP